MKKINKTESQMQYYQQQIKKRNTGRWIIVLLYLLISLSVSVIPLFTTIDDSIYTLIIFPVIFGGLIIVFLVLLYPSVNKLSLPDIKDENIVKIKDNSKIPQQYHEENKQIIFYVIAPIIILIISIIVYLLLPEIGPIWLIGLILFSVSLFVVLLLFGKIDVLVDQSGINIRFGTINELIPISNIKTIRSISIHPLKDFMGYGIRIGPDGAKGYIASGKVGIKITTNDEKVLVITVKNPQIIVTIIRHQKEKNKISSNK